MRHNIGHSPTYTFTRLGTRNLKHQQRRISIEIGSAAAQPSLGHKHWQSSHKMDPLLVIDTQFLFLRPHGWCNRLIFFCNQFGPDDSYFMGGLKALKAISNQIISCKQQDVTQSDLIYYKSRPLALVLEFEMSVLRIVK